MHTVICINTHIYNYVSCMCMMYKNVDVCKCIFLYTNKY